MASYCTNNQNFSGATKNDEVNAGNKYFLDNPPFFFFLFFFCLPRESVSSLMPARISLCLILDASSLRMFFSLLIY